MRSEDLEIMEAKWIFYYGLVEDLFPLIQTETLRLDSSLRQHAKPMRYGLAATYPDHGQSTATNPQDLVDTLSTLPVDEPGSMDGELFSEFVERLNELAPWNDIPTQVLENLWVPFLRHLIPILKLRNIPFAHPRYQKLYQTVLDAYSRRFVGIEPTEDRNLVRPTVSCPCRDCTWLNGFLRNPQLRAERYSVGKQRRYHLHKQIEKHNIDCTHTTDHTGYTHTLQLEKTFKQNAAARIEWKKRRNMARVELEKFPQEELMALLGGDGVEGKYVQIVGMNI